MSAELNEYLEQQASQWQIWSEENNQKVGWPDYYRGLKDIETKDYFILSSATAEWSFFDKPDPSPLRLWLRANYHRYNTVGHTGYCEFFKKD